MSLLCFPSAPSSSSGVWMQSNPTDANLPLLMIQVTVAIVTSRVVHRLLQPLKQPIIVSQLLTGILLGPSALGRIGFFRTLYSENKTVGFKMVGFLGLCLFSFIIAVKIDFSLIKKSGKKAVAVSVVSNVFPLALSFAVLFLAGGHLIGADSPAGNAQFFSDSVFTWSISPLVVVVSILDEIRLLNSKLGRLATAVSLIATAAEISLRLVTTTVFVSKAVANPWMRFVTFTLFLAFLAFIVFVGRPVTNLMVKRTRKGETLAEGYFTMVMFLAFFCGFASEALGHHVFAGMFLLGLALPSGPPLGSTLVERLESLVNGLFFPLFVVGVGFATDFSQIFHFLSELKYLLLFNLVTVAAKVAATVLIGVYCRMSLYDAVVLALMLNTRGISHVMEVHLMQDAKVMSVPFYTVMLCQILVTAAVVTPMISTLYKPSKRYRGQTRRTIQNTRSNIELRVLTCIHKQDSVPAAVNLLESLCTSEDDKHPLCVYVLRMSQLVGRVATVLFPYRKGKDSAYVTESTDRVMTAFWNFEEKVKSRADRCALAVHPFVCISPYATMYDDICNLVVEKRVTLVVLPFHRMEIGGNLESDNRAFQAVNVDVLTYTPCSVGILIDHGILKDTDTALTNLIHNVVVYFFGGPDDREALALAMRMAANPRVGVTVVRFRSNVDVKAPSKRTTEEKLDHMVVYDFDTERKKKTNMVYREEVVERGEEMVNFIRATSKSFDLIIVGRREGMEFKLTEGLSTWSEYPELGLIGDMLASKDFGIQVSTLVIQQQSPGIKASREC